MIRAGRDMYAAEEFGSIVTVKKKSKKEKGKSKREKGKERKKKEGTKKEDKERKKVRVKE